MTDSRKVITWLFNPFVYVAGGKALLVGVIAILAAGYIGSYSNTHFDGVIDVHSGKNAPLWFFLAAGILDWLCMGLVFWMIGTFVVRKPFRAIDIFGTQAMARWPTLLTAFATLLPGYTRFTHVIIKFSRTQKFPEGTNPADAVAFGVVLCIVLLVLYWTVPLMYNSYQVSCDPDRGKAVRTFVVGLVIAEVISKVVIFALIKLI